jgi:DNA mismatch repair protein MSH3
MRCRLLPAIPSPEQSCVAVRFLRCKSCRQAVAAVAQLDALQSLASLAASPGYCRPQFLDNSQPQQLLLVDGKHPMLDLALDGAAVGNTLELRWDGVRAAVVTG